MKLPLISTRTLMLASGIMGLLLGSGLAGGIQELRVRSLQRDAAQRAATVATAYADELERRNQSAVESARDRIELTRSFHEDFAVLLADRDRLARRMQDKIDANRAPVPAAGDPPRADRGAEDRRPEPPGPLAHDIADTVTEARGNNVTHGKLIELLLREVGRGRVVVE